MLNKQILLLGPLLMFLMPAVSAKETCADYKIYISDYFFGTDKYNNLLKIKVAVESAQNDFERAKILHSHITIFMHNLDWLEKVERKITPLFKDKKWIPTIVFGKPEKRNALPAEQLTNYDNALEVAYQKLKINPSLDNYSRIKSSLKENSSLNLK